LHAPTQAELGWGTHFDSTRIVVRGLGGFGTGAFGFGRYRRWDAGLQLGFGAGYCGGDRSGGWHGKYGAVGWSLWRALEVDERGQFELESGFGHVAGFDGRSAYAGGGRDCSSAGEQRCDSG